MAGFSVAASSYGAGMCRTACNAVNCGDKSLLKRPGPYIPCRTHPPFSGGKNLGDAETNISIIPANHTCTL